MESSNAAALCFYRQPEKVSSGCYVKIGKFEGSEIVYQMKRTAPC